MHGHGAAVVVDVVAALAVGEPGRAGRSRRGWRGWGQRVGAVRVPDAEGDLDGLGVDEGRAAGQRDAADPRGGGGERAQRAGEVLHVAPRRHVACVACFQLVVQALRQLILGSGGDYLHACLYTLILTRTAKENYSSSAYINIDTRGIAFCSAKPCKSYYCLSSCPHRPFGTDLRRMRRTAVAPMPSRTVQARPHAFARNMHEAQLPANLIRAVCTAVAIKLARSSIAPHVLRRSCMPTSCGPGCIAIAAEAQAQGRMPPRDTFLPWHANLSRT